MHSASPASIALYLAIIALFVYRLVRPQRISTVRLWVMPFFLVALTAFAVWGTGVAAAQLGYGAPGTWQLALALCAGVVVGIPLGLFRGRHSDVKATGKPNVMYVRSSPLIVVVWLAAFAARSLIRFLMPHAGAASALAGDGLMAFAAAALIVSYAVIYRRFRALEVSSTSIAAGTSA